MKKHITYILMAAILVYLVACKKDNYDAPSTTLSGRIVYAGEAVMVEKGQVRLQLWEPGWGLLAPIDVPIDQDGTFSALLFNGNYKLAFVRNDGPWMTKQSGSAKDTIMLSVQGNQQLDIEVQPFYMIRNAQINAAGGKINASCKIDKIITGGDARNVESVSLYVNKTLFVGANGNYQIARKDSTVNGATDMNNLQLSVNIPGITPGQNFVYARIGVKIQGVEDRIFSEVKKIMY